MWCLSLYTTSQSVCLSMIWGAVLSVYTTWMWAKFPHSCSQTFERRHAGKKVSPPKHDTKNMIEERTNRTNCDWNPFYHIATRKSPIYTYISVFVCVYIHTTILTSWRIVVVCSAVAGPGACFGGIVWRAVPVISDSIAQRNRRHRTGARHLYMHTYVCNTYIHTYYVYKCILKYTHTHAYIYACIDTCIDIHKNMCEYVHVSMHKLCARNICNMHTRKGI